ncbi:MAG: glycosyltransferase, partial [Acidobacteriota bacterium]|nr:glycosyltransferase [Acidobacteriota bacterium]
IELPRVLEAGRIIDPEFFRVRTPGENEPMRVLLVGPSQVESKGIADGYGAAAHARWFHQKFELIRASPWAPSREEPLDDVQEFHVGMTFREMSRLMHTCDVLIGPSHAGDEFGLAAARALASGVPAVLTAVPAYQSFDAVHDYALFSGPENAVELGEQLIELLGDYELRERVRRRGTAVAEQWRAESVIDRLEAFLVERLAVRQR